MPLPAKLAAAQSELQACEAHLASKERELAAMRTAAVRRGLTVRCTALAECGQTWTAMGTEALRSLGTLEGDAPVMNGVTLASLHSAKGLEWEAVFLAGLNEGLMPISFAKTGDEIDEERRLLYVGITRARKHLTFTWSRSRTPGGRANRKRSRFLSAITSEKS